MAEENIYNYEKRYETLKSSIKNDGKISTKNKKLFYDFEEVCQLEGLSIPRRIKLLETLQKLAKEYIKKDFDKINKNDLKKALIKVDNLKIERNGKKCDCSPWTRQSYRAIIKKFFKWLEYGDNYKDETNYPELVSWVKTNIKSKDKPKVQAGDLLTEEEIKKLIDAADHPRDKAFISMLYELGARISEIGNLSIKNVTKDKYSFIIDLKGKTGHRTPRIVISDPYITTWLNNHPLKENLNAPLWVTEEIETREKEEGTNGQKKYVKIKCRKHIKMQYDTLRSLLLRLKEKAGIQKRIHNHLFRHTRVTHLLLNKQINEAQAKVYFGWVPSSKMLSEYSHLLSKDVNEAILEIYGIKTGEKRESLLKPQQCPRCGTINAKDSLFCKNCTCILDTSTALKMDKINKITDDLNEGYLTKKDPNMNMKEYVDKYVEQLVKQRLQEIINKK